MARHATWVRRGSWSWCLPVAATVPKVCVRSHFAGIMLPSVVDAGPPLHAWSVGSRVPISDGVLDLAVGDLRTYGIIETASRRRDIGGPGVFAVQFKGRFGARKAIGLPGSASRHHAAALAPGGCAKLKVVPSLHIRCRTTPRRRATATTARFMPRRLATCMPQALSQLFVCDW